MALVIGKWSLLGGTDCFLARSLSLIFSSLSLPRLMEASLCNVPTPARPGPYVLSLSLLCMLSVQSLAVVPDVPLLPFLCIWEAAQPGLSKSKLPCFLARTALVILVLVGGLEGGRGSGGRSFVLDLDWDSTRPSSSTTPMVVPRYL